MACRVRVSIDHIRLSYYGVLLPIINYDSVQSNSCWGTERRCLVMIFCMLLNSFLDFPIKIIALLFWIHFILIVLE